MIKSESPRLLSNPYTENKDLKNNAKVLVLK